MLQLKQIVLNCYTKTLESTLSAAQTLNGHFRAHLSSPLAENLGKTLSSLVLLKITTILGIAMFILNLSLLTVQMSMKLAEQLKNTGRQVWNALFILCRWVAEVKDTILPSKKYQSSAWSGDGGLHPDYTYPYSVMHGEREKLRKENEHIKAMEGKSTNEPEYDTDFERRAREAGL